MSTEGITFFNDNWDVGSITIDTGSSYGTMLYDGCTWNTITSGYVSVPKHFNCKRCGAPNQVDVCEYCGSAAEE